MQGGRKVIKYQEEIKKESQRYHKKANKVDWGRLARELPQVRKEYGRRIG